MPIHKICILGAGTLGSRVALQSAISGFEVHVYDIHQKALDFGQKTMEKILRQLVKAGQLNESQLPEIFSRIQFTLDPSEAVKDADFINESVTEEVDIKKKVWKQFGEIAPEKTWFTTNTSYLLPSMFAEESGRPTKFCAFRYRLQLLHGQHLHFYKIDYLNIPLFADIEIQLMNQNHTQRYD